MENTTDFDIIVVGAGCAGAVAAYVAASAGKSVLLIERGVYAGSKNMTGGRIYSHALKEVFPDFEKTAPLERKVTHERLSLLDIEASTTIDFSSKEFLVEGQDSYIVLRGHFDQWLAEKAETAGATYINGIAVEHLLKNESGKVTGVSAGGDDITAHITIVSDGANSLLAGEATGAPKPSTEEMAVGIKEVLTLPRNEIGSRFAIDNDEGVAWLFVGDCTHGNVGGGFLYTNKDSISLGLVATISGLAKADTTICQMLDDFKRHPIIAPVIKGATLAEHSGHMVSEGGYNSIPTLVADGVILSGDAAMLCMNLGYMVRGMDLAVASGRMAAEASIKAIDANDVSKTTLNSYVDSLNNSFVMQDLQTFKNWPVFMGSWNRMFTTYPALIANIGDDMFVVDGTPQKPIKKNILGNIKSQVGLMTLMKDLRRAMNSL